MLDHIKEYFSQVPGGQKSGKYHKVLVLHDTPDIAWKDISAAVPSLVKGWYELAHLSSKDRVEFTRDFWISKLPYHPEMLPCILDFFCGVEDIGVVISQRSAKDPFETHLIYALDGGRGFFHGRSGMTAKEASVLQRIYPGTIFPADYLAFMEIHNGFSKTTDTGIIPTYEMEASLKRFLNLVGGDNPPMTTNRTPVDPHSLIPFYESFGMPFYQCFWKDWYPQNEMGNVYYSGSTQMISDIVNVEESEDSMAFETFLDWLIFYLDKVG